MKIKTIISTILMLVLSVVTYANTTFTATELSEKAISDNPKEAEIAIKELRELGEKGLQTLFETYAVEIENFKRTGEQTEKWQKIAHALDTVAMQKDVYASKLFWHKDLAAAQVEARRTRKPILSLRLLGNLNEEFSCANSRFFRAILYPNANISTYLRANYILHWQSVRPAPKVTIDFGDGRKIERTITGNSIHYVLDKDGNVIDAMAGLNSPQVFAEFLRTGYTLANQVVNVEPLQPNQIRKATSIEQFRRDKYQTLTAQMNRTAQQLKLTFDPTRRASRNFEEMPSAVYAMNIAIGGKRSIEIPILINMTSAITKYGEDQINLENWQRITKLIGITAKLDENSIAFIRRQNAKTNLSQQEFASMIAKLEEYVSVDTARNEFLLRPTLMVWLEKGEDKNIAKLNEKIYSQLFLTPSADKWLGLYAADIYTALDGNGIK